MPFLFDYFFRNFLFKFPGLYEFHTKTVCKTKGFFVKNTGARKCFRNYFTPMCWASVLKAASIPLTATARFASNPPCQHPQAMLATPLPPFPPVVPPVFVCTVKPPKNSQMYGLIWAASSTTWLLRTTRFRCCDWTLTVCWGLNEKSVKVSIPNIEKSWKFYPIKISSEIICPSLDP